MTAATPTLLTCYHILSYEEIDSTNEEARRLAMGGGAHGAVIWAEKQTAGRGRQGKRWESPPGNLYASLLLRVTQPLELLPQLTLVAGMAMHEALSPMLQDSGKLELKWPNDLLWEDNKLAGILSETLHIKGSSYWAIVGVGVNIDNHPEKVEWPATSLKKAGVEIVSAKIVLSRFLYQFACAYQEWEQSGFDAVRKSWTKHAWRSGKEMTVILPKGEISGKMAGLSDTGALQLKTADGKTRAVTFGDVKA